MAKGKKAFHKRGNKLLNTLKSVQKSFLANETPLVTGYDGLVNLRLIEELRAKMSGSEELIKICHKVYEKRICLRL